MTKTLVWSDVSQLQLDVMVSQEAGPWYVPHDAAGIALVCQRLARIHPDRTVL